MNFFDKMKMFFLGNLTSGCHGNTFVGVNSTSLANVTNLSVPGMGKDSQNCFNITDKTAPLNYPNTAQNDSSRSDKLIK